MKILKLYPDGICEVKNIKNNLESFQQEVGGLIDVIEMPDKIDLIVNDEFLLNGSEPSLYINHDLIIFGECFFTTYEDLTEEQINYLFRKLLKIENEIFIWI